MIRPDGNKGAVSRETGGPRDVVLHMASLEEIAGELHRRARRSCNHCQGTGRQPGRPGLACPVCDGTGMQQAGGSLWDIYQVLNDLVTVE